MNTRKCRRRVDESYGYRKSRCHFGYSGCSAGLNTGCPVWQSTSILIRNDLLGIWILYVSSLFGTGSGSEFFLNKFLLLLTDPVVVDAQTRDPQGRTPLMLAVCLGHLDSSKLLIEAGANVNTETEGWTVVQVG